MPDGVKTRAQRRKEAAGGAPSSPARMLPLTAPRRVPRRKPKKTNETRESTPTAASGSETERTEEPGQPQDSARTQSSEPEHIVQSVETQEHNDTTGRTSSETATSSLNPNNQLLLITPNSSAHAGAISSQPAEGANGSSAASSAGSRAAYRSATPSPSSSAAAEPQTQSRGTMVSSSAQADDLPEPNVKESAMPVTSTAITPAPPAGTPSSSASSSSPFTWFRGSGNKSPYSITWGRPKIPSWRDIQLARRGATFSSSKNFPSAERQAEKHAVLHLWTDADVREMTDEVPATQPTTALVVPMAHLASVLQNFAAQYPGAQPSQPLTRSTGTQTALTAGKKRKATDDIGSSQPSRRVRFSEQSTSSSPASQSAGAGTNSHRVIRYRQAKLHDVNGVLGIGQPDVPVYSDEDSSMQEDAGSPSDQNDIMQVSSQATQANAALEHIPETPAPSRWLFGSIMNTASRFVPGLGRRTAPTTPATQRPNIASSLVNSTPQVLRPQHPRTEPRANVQGAVSRTHTPASELSQKTPSIAKFFQQRESNKVSKRSALPARELRKAKRLREQAEAGLSEAETRQAELDRIMEQKRELEAQHLEEKRELEEQQKLIEDEIIREESEAQLKKLEEWRAKKEADPNFKEKRPPSPTVIPNPKGCSFGLDLRYFIDDHSSDEEDEPSPPPSPTPERRHKEPRLSPSEPMGGDKAKAQPYTGAFFGEATPTHQGGNVFDETAVNKAASDKASVFKKAAAVTSKAAKTPKSPPRTEDGRIITNLSGHFTVPDDETEDENSELSNSSSPSGHKTLCKDPPAALQSPAPALPTLSSAQQPTQTTATSVASSELPGLTSPPSGVPGDKAKAPTWSQPPPAPPSPSHATLPTLPVADVESLNAARAKALKHAPKKPSTLREFSRINSSPLAAPEAVSSQSETSAASLTAMPPASSDQVIAQIENNVANNPTPPLAEVLGVLSEKAPNGHVEVRLRTLPTSLPLTDSS